MTHLQTLTTKRLRALMTETETTLTDFKKELDRREELAQEVEIANLENHMRSAELNLRSIRDFLTFLSSDINKNKA